MNYTKVVNHKKRTVIPILNVEVRGRINFLFSLLFSVPVFVILFLISSTMGVAGGILTFIGLSIYLNEIDDEKNSVIYKKYIELVHKSGVQNICWFNGEKSRITNKKKQSCNIINFTKYRRLDV